MKIVVTGAAGFIGSHIIDALLSEDRVKNVLALDNLSTGNRDNLQHITDSRFRFIEGDIRDRNLLSQVFEGVDVVCHQAALGSVPRSILLPDDTHQVNVDGTFNVFDIARLHGVKRVVYASSSSVYGDGKLLPKKEGEEGKVLSPYALSKSVNEQYAHQFYKHYGLENIGLRYFNVFGPRQNPEGPYAAVIPLFIKWALNGERAQVHGDGLQSRDFTYVANAVQANIKAILHQGKPLGAACINIAFGQRTNLLELWKMIGNLTGNQQEPRHQEPREGDVRDSLADITRAKDLLGFQPEDDLWEGLRKTIESYHE